MNHLFIYSFYRFKNLQNIKKIKSNLDKFLENKNIKGTILIAEEGINGSISGSMKQLDDIIKYIKIIIKIRNLDIKINKNKFHPFNRMKVRLKKEIVSLGQGDIDINRFKGKLVNPKDWDDIITEKKVKIIDVRNNFEICIGSFHNSINPKTDSFRDFPRAIENMKLNKNDKIAMYCTGGIRCEKASSYLKLKGYKKVYQLDGGIISYLDYAKNKSNKMSWKGECFVFDERVTINKKLLKGNYLQCYGCRRPLAKKDTRSKYYIKGVSCSYCFKKRSTSQIKRSKDRQRQINIAKLRGKDHPFKKVSL